MLSQYRSAIMGFNTAAAAYDRGRPAYPPQVTDLLVEKLALRPQSHVLDLAAGTGKLTEALLPFLSHIEAVEPVEGMRAIFSAKFPLVTVRDGTAEAIPHEDGAFDAVVVGTAFHWFDTERALAEIARVLRVRGTLGLVWMMIEDREPWIREFVALNERYRKATTPEKRGSANWAETLKRSPLFEDVGHSRVPFEYAAPPSMIVERTLSQSFVGALEPRERLELVESVERFAQSHPCLAGKTEIALPYCAELYWLRKKS